MSIRLPIVALVLAALAAFGVIAAAFAPSHGLAMFATDVAPANSAAPRSGAPPGSAAISVRLELPLETVPPATATAEPVATQTATVSPTAATRPAVVLRVPVLMYHYISAVPTTQSGDRFAVDLRVPPDLFEQHLAYLHDQGYTTITAPQLWDALTGGGSLPAKPIMLTFDDGYADAYTNALPLLQKYDFVGTFFITCNLVGRPGYMTWDQVRALDAAGMDIESHAMDHRPMSSFSLGGLAYQMGESRATLARQVGHEVRFFAYPSGDYNATALQGVSANGYAAAFLKGGGSSQSSDWRYTLRRTRITGYASLDQFKAALRY